jgi:outer membrane receptor for ferrienterochelin and colicin
MKMHDLLRLRVGLAACLVSGLFFTAPAIAQDESDEELEAFRVTGSRLSRIDLQGVNPVDQLSPEMLDERGYATIGDALRSLPYTSGQSLTPDSSGTSFTPGVSTFNLRGIGNNNVLVLVNGRRAAPFGASGFNGFQSLFDFNSLPTSAIERVDILKDGASAIYGADAVSGVVNIILRRDFEGLSVRGRIGNTYKTDSFERTVSAVFGTSTEKTSIIVTADWYERNALFARDYDFTSNADLTDVGGIDRRSTGAYPALVFVPGLGYHSFPEPTTNPTAAAAVPYGTDLGDGRTAGLYNFLQNSDVIPETRFYGFFTSVTHNIKDDLELFADLSFRRAETLSQSAPTPLFNFNEQGYRYELLSDTELGVTADPTNRDHYGAGQVPSDVIIPAYNPFNPFGVDLIDDVRFRIVPAGNRKNEVQSDTPRLLAGLRGEVGDWNWETAAMYTKSTYTNSNGGAHQDRLVQDAFHGVTFNAGSPEEVTLYLNPFGPSDDRIMDYITISNPITSSYEVITYDVEANGPIFELDAGSVGLAVGAEYREENLDDRRTALNETAQIVGGSEGSSVQGKRDVKALFAEVGIPVLDNLEVQVAARYERYSDFGSTTKPKIAAVFRPTPDILLRASFGESFLAPNLPFLYTSQSTSFTAAALVDPKRPNDQATQIKMLGGGNPDLEPEETEGVFIGAAYNPNEGILKGLYVGVDLFYFDSENLIDRFEAETILDNEDEPAFAGLVVRNPPVPGETVGTLNFVRTTWENVGGRKYKGMDIDLRYDFETDTMGRFRLGMMATYLDELSYDGTGFQGSRLYPRWRGNFNAAWHYADWSASVFVEYIDSRSGTGQTNASGAQVTNARYGSHYTINPRITYRGFMDTSISIGATNVTDRTPPLDYGEAERWTAIMNPQKGFYYLEVTKEF